MLIIVCLGPGILGSSENFHHFPLTVQNHGEDGLEFKKESKELLQLPPLQNPPNYLNFNKNSAAKPLIELSGFNPIPSFKGENVIGSGHEWVLSCRDRSARWDEDKLLFLVHVFSRIRLELFGARAAAEIIRFAFIGIAGCFLF